MGLSKQSLIDFLSQIALNKYMQVLFIIVISLCVAKIIDVIISCFIKKWILKIKIASADQLVEIVQKTIFISIIILGLGIAIEKLGLKENISYITLGGLQTIIIIYWSIAATRMLKLILNLLSNDKKRFKFIQEHSLSLFNNFLLLAVSGISIYIIFLIWNIDLTAWIASAGILGLAISFAAKDTLANLFSGIFILADAPYKLGDFIVLDSGERGEVTNIGIRSTRLLTRSDVEITVPNSIMGNSRIVNEAGGRHEKFRVSVKIGVAYGSDIDHVYNVLLDVAKKNENVCADPEPRVRFRAFGESSLDYELLCWIERPVLRGKTIHMLNTDVYKCFIKEGIEIPFPQRDVHIQS